MDGARAELAAFVVGYLAILLVPGPNMLAVGMVAGLRGLAAALPIVAGLSVGVLLLGMALLGLVHLPGVAVPDQVARLAAAALLLGAALWILRRQPPASPPLGAAPHVEPGQAVAASARLRALEAQGLFLAGVGTAATNPITGAYLVAQFLAWSQAPTAPAAPAAPAGLVLLGAGLTGSVMLAAALLFSRPGVRRMVLARHAAVRWMAVGALAAFAVATAWQAVDGR